MLRVLIVGGDGTRAATLCDGLRRQGFGVVCARTVAAGARLVPDVDLAILALGRAGANGSDLDALLDRVERRMPVVVVAEPARSEPEPVERSPLDEYAFDDVTVDFQRYRATKAGVGLDLSPREYEMLRYLIEQRDRVVSRRELLNDVWGYRGASYTRTVDVHIAKLRRKIGDPSLMPKYILTVHRAGYRFIA